MNTMNHTAPRTANRLQAATLRRARLLLALCLVWLGLLAAAPAFAKDYTFTWTANPEPVEGYKLYYKKDGIAAQPFDGTGVVEGPSPINVGKVTTYTITGLDDNATYHFVLTAYNGSEESGFSEVLSIFPSNSDKENTAPVLLKITLR